MIVPVEMFASWYYIENFDIFSVVIEPNVEWCFLFTNVLNVADIVFLYINNEAAFTVDSYGRFKRFVVVVFFIITYTSDKKLQVKS